jgi:hypothetical protein
MKWLAGIALVVALGCAALLFFRGDAGDPQPPVGSSCPASHPIKGNAGSGIYHEPGSPFYDETDPEECFATPEDAEKAGYRASRAE